MHIEKNIFDNTVNTLLDVKHKSKDNLASRFDMEKLKMNEDLHAKQDDDLQGDHNSLESSVLQLGH